MSVYVAAVFRGLVQFGKCLLMLSNASISRMLLSENETQVTLVIFCHRTICALDTMHL